MQHEYIRPDMCMHVQQHEYTRPDIACRHYKQQHMCFKPGRVKTRHVHAGPKQGIGRHSHVFTAASNLLFGCRRGAHARMSWPAMKLRGGSRYCRPH
eukprot:1159308-Pelagomonas_calceolata.AAC.7